MRLTILHTNDLHGALTPEKAARIRELKEANQPCLYFDSGDCIKAGNLAIPLRPDPAWALLAEAGCDAGTLGNRESHLLEAGFRAKLAGAAHPLLCANLRMKGTKERRDERTAVTGRGAKVAGSEGRRDGAPGGQEKRGGLGYASHEMWAEACAPLSGTIPSSHHPIISSPSHPLPGSLILEIAGIRVVVIGAMVPMVTERMKTAFASAYLWDPPIPAVVEMVEGRRAKVEGRGNEETKRRRDGGTGGLTIHELRLTNSEGHGLAGIEGHAESDPGPQTQDPGPAAQIRQSSIADRHSVGLLLALTHIGIHEDRRLAEACPELDLILGGHSHTVLDQPERIGRTWICQGGSHGRVVGRYVWEIGVGLVESGLIPLA